MTHRVKRPAEETGGLGAESGDLRPHVLQQTAVLSNAEIIATLYGPKRGSLRQRFLTALHSLQLKQVGIEQCSSTLNLNFGRDQIPVEAIQRLMNRDSLPVNWQLSRTEEEEMRQKMTKALGLLGRLFPVTRETLTVITSEFIFARCPDLYGGSTSGVPSVIWFGMPPSWSVTQLAECIVHEYVHQCLFLEDMVRTLFSTSVPQMDSAGLVTSAVLARRRGYDKSFHSVFVSHAIRQFYQRCGRPPAAIPPLDRLISTLCELHEHKRFLTQNGVGILQQLTTEIESLKRRQIAA